MSDIEEDGWHRWSEMEQEADVKQAAVAFRDLIAFIRVQIKRGGYSHRDGVATCPAELMLNIDAILDAAERGAERAP